MARKRAVVWLPSAGTALLHHQLLSCERFARACRYRPPLLLDTLWAWSLGRSIELRNFFLDLCETTTSSFNPGTFLPGLSDVLRNYPARLVQVNLWPLFKLLLDLSRSFSRCLPCWHSNYNLLVGVSTYVPHSYEPCVSYPLHPPRCWIIPAGQIHVGVADSKYRYSYVLSRNLYVGGSNFWRVSREGRLDCSRFTLIILLCVCGTPSFPCLYRMSGRVILQCGSGRSWIPSGSLVYRRTQLQDRRLCCSHT